MKYILPIFSCLLLSACGFKSKQADLIIHNATIICLDEAGTKEDAVAVKDGKIVAIGPEREILNEYNSTEFYDAKKQFVYPGFIDAHAHFVNYALGLEQLNLFGVKSEEELIDKVVEFAKTKEPGDWIVGRGWDHTDWENKQLPGNEKLNELIPNNPILLHRIDGHAALANAKALSLANIDPTSKIEGGVIEVINGKLTGIIKENAADAILQKIPDPTLADYERTLSKAQNNLFKVGLTGLCDAGLSLNALQALVKLDQANKLKIDVYAMASNTAENIAYWTKNGAYEGNRLHIRSFKFYADGSLGSRSAFLKDPYHDAPHQSGLMTLSIDSLKETLEQLKNAGLQANTHCIGDSSLSLVLQAYAEVLGGTNDNRWRIEHAQVTDQADWNLFQENSIVPSVQPTHATSDMKWAEERIGKDRLRTAYAYKSLMELNGWIPLGTDFPVEDIDPLKTFVSAVFRRKLSGEPNGGFEVQEALTAEQALKGMTIWAALAEFQETNLGSIEVGKSADFVILNSNLLKSSFETASQTKVQATFIKGEKVY